MAQQTDGLETFRRFVRGWVPDTRRVSVFNPPPADETPTLRIVLRQSNWCEGLLATFLYHHVLCLWDGYRDATAKTIAGLARKGKRSNETRWQLGTCLYLGVGYPQDKQQAFALFLEAARAGHAASAANVAAMLDLGVGCVANETASRQWYAAVIHSNDDAVVAAALSNLALLALRKQQYDAVQGSFEAAARRGLVAAVNNLAVFALRGHAKGISGHSAVKHLLRAHAAGEVYASYNLFVCCYHGVADTVPRSFANALIFLCCAASLPQAIHNIAFLQHNVILDIDRAKKDAAHNYLLASRNRVRQSEINLAVGLLHGDFGSINTNDLKMAVRVFKMHRKTSHICQLHLALCYFHGYVLRKNVAKARALFDAAMANGNSFARFYIGVAHMLKNEVNHGTDLVTDAAASGYWVANSWLGRFLYAENPNDAIPLLDEAALLKDNAALYALAIHHMRQKDFARMLLFLQLLVLRKHPEAMVLLGVCHLRGIGVPQNLSVARTLFKEAGRWGNKKGREYARLTKRLARSM